MSSGLGLNYSKAQGALRKISETQATPAQDGGLNPRKPRVSFIKHTREGVSVNSGHWIKSVRSRLDCFINLTGTQ